ncbi:phosphatase PAP2 family protein [Brevundimonas sp. UBA7664]|uniref:phosphatase PAP2 family protein n=1 Tax=Brevundimonas sp. UBA7664 TaxID=1946141 RepID=UPI0025C05479|nr:phosphatase PAP2 family protein [Brevundimonas sp. UBA7664]
MTSSPIRTFLGRAWRIARAEITALSALFIIAVGIMSFVELSDDMTEADGQAFDQAVLTWMQPTPGDPRGGWWLEEAAADLTSLGGISVLALFGTIALVFLIIQRKHLSALLLAAGVGGGVALSEGLKALFGRERPPQDFQAVDTLNASFPSGHALLAAVFYLTLGVMLTQAFPRRHLKAFVLGAAILIAVLIGLTRVYLGAHWASDVLAGWSVGAAWAMVLWLVAYAVRRRQAVHAGGPHDETLPGEAITDTDRPVIGE